MFASNSNLILINAILPHVTLLFVKGTLHHLFEKFEIENILTESKYPNRTNRQTKCSFYSP